MPTIYTEVEVDVDLDSFSDDDLLDEVERRGLDLETAHATGNTGTGLVSAIYYKRRQGQDYQRELDELIYATIGRILWLIDLI